MYVRQNMNECLSEKMSEWHADKMSEREKVEDVVISETAEYELARE